MTEIRRDSMASIAEYATIPSAFVVASVVAIEQLQVGASNIHVNELPVDVPYIKDYDALPESSPLSWAARLDTSHWEVFSAWLDGVRVGGAIASPGSSTTPATLDDELWDLRVHRDYRRRGVGEALFRAVEAWSAARGSPALRIETQHNNVGACRFYAKQGCKVESIEAHAYPDLPDEIRVMWRKGHR